MKNLLMMGASLGLLAGCAPFMHTEAPLASNFATTTQLKLQAAQHWQTIADHAADSIASALASGSTCAAPAGNCPLIHVKTATPPSAFGQGFHTGFVSRLVNKGLNVAAAEPGDINIAIDIQAVNFSADRRQYLGAAKFTQLTFGLWALHEIDPSGAAVGVAAMAADIYEWNMSQFAKGPTPSMEVIVTASATRGRQIVARSTNVYYIADTDAALYLPPHKPAPTIRVVGESGAPK